MAHRAINQLTMANDSSKYWSIRYKINNIYIIIANLRARDNKIKCENVFAYKRLRYYTNDNIQKEILRSEDIENIKIKPAGLRKLLTSEYWEDLTPLIYFENRINPYAKYRAFMDGSAIFDYTMKVKNSGNIGEEYTDNLEQALNRYFKMLLKGYTEVTVLPNVTNISIASNNDKFDVMFQIKFEDYNVLYNIDIVKNIYSAVHFITKDEALKSIYRNTNKNSSP